MTSSPSLRAARKLSDDIGERLLKRIQSGEFAPGDPLPSERELMRAYAVGRPAIREAMQDLQRMGLLEIRHGRRARVAAPSIGRMVDQIGETMRHFLANSPASLEQLQGGAPRLRNGDGADRRPQARGERYRPPWRYFAGPSRGAARP